MEWFEAIILGLVQGLTEFLPVSSSGHLVIGKELLGIETSDDLVFEVLVHAATVLSTIVVFRRQIWNLLKGLFRFRDRTAPAGTFRINDETDYILKICVSMIPIFIVGVFFKDFVEGLFGSLASVGAALMVTAVLLFFSDLAGRMHRGKKPSSGSASDSAPVKAYRNGISWWQAAVVGIGQAFAVAPGLSRSGTTIATGLICGVKREVMAQFSFLMVLVPILGETFLQLVGGELTGSSLGWLPLLLGFVSAFLSGLFACKAMIALVKKARLSWFALYCAIVAIIILTVTLL